MRAAWYDRKGPAREVLTVGELERPEAGPGQVLVRLHASAVNPSDTKQRGGARGNLAMPWPRIVPHQDGAGVIEAVGSGVSRAWAGERVWVYEAQRGSPFGTAAEYTAVAAHRAVPLPEGVSFAEGACLGVPAMTAHRAVFADGPVHGQTILVTGGAGAVGGYAVQFARWGGAALVLATVSRPEQEIVARASGADEVINYRTENVVERVNALTAGTGVNRVVEVAFGRNLETALAVLRPTGVIATYSSDAVPEPVLPYWRLVMKDLTVRFVLVYEMSRAAHDAAATDITACLAKGVLRHQIGVRGPLDDIARLHEAQESGSLVGKAVVEIG
jgi:NADPH:quinone reductase